MEFGICKTCNLSACTSIDSVKDTSFDRCLLTDSLHDHWDHMAKANIASQRVHLEVVNVFYIGHIKTRGENRKRTAGFAIKLAIQCPACSTLHRCTSSHLVN